MHEIILKGPHKNALGARMLDHLLNELEAADGEPVLLTGDGDTFSAGVDLQEILTYDPVGMAGYLSKLDRTIAALFDYPAPTVAAVNGHAIAGGAVLTLCCDVRVCSDDPRVRIGLNENAIGVSFPPGILNIVRYRVPDAWESYVLLGGGLFSPQEAQRLGLVDILANDVLTRARKELARLAQHPRQTYAELKAQLREGLTNVSEADWHKFSTEMLYHWTSGNTREKIRTLLKK